MSNVEAEGRIIQVDGETMNDFASAMRELIEFLDWLMRSQNLEAYNKLCPIVRKLHAINRGILAGVDPFFEEVFDNWERFEDQLNSQLAEAKTLEETEQILAEARAVSEDFQAKVEAALKAGKGQKH